MVKWKPIIKQNENQLFWDNLFKNKLYTSFYQSYNWGEYKRNFKWIPYRLTCHEESSDICLEQIQILVKSYKINFFYLWIFRISICWIPGVSIETSKFLDNNFIQLIKKLTKSNIVYLRSSIFSSYSTINSIILISQNWRRALVPLSTGLSMVHDLTIDLSQLDKIMSSNWRHNLKRGLTKNSEPKKWDNPSAKKIFELYRDVELKKNIAEQFSLSEIEKLLQYFGENLIIFKVENIFNEVIAIRGCIIWGNTAFDLFAAANEEARKIYASHVILAKLLKYCISQNVIRYDMAGIDPINGKGVYHFKKGSGAKEIEYMGEWEQSNSKILRLIINFKVSRISNVNI
ncbi:lipid II:glycine glycyltransferase FemX [Fluviispira vulneris]|uniref:lipid II:glycine glycyltransferase FemX n=1 Tax=Fluviispira vulneris TaxID=2763012 RepID=UPI00164550FD|nr:peptidoglycan bridge formation glycyltransferase FemA/FemB family protein [Fluviispira vulneris]